MGDWRTDHDDLTSLDEYNEWDSGDWDGFTGAGLEQEDPSDDDELAVLKARIEEEEQRAAQRDRLLAHHMRMEDLMDKARKKQRGREYREEMELKRRQREKRLPWIFWPIFALLVATGAS